jgi:uncharacterized protein involved in copper resistance
MSVERHHEHAERNEQATAELEAARREKLEQLRHSTESEPQDAEHRAEAAREIIHKHEQAPEPTDHHEAAPADPQPKPFLDHRLNYKQTLASLQRQLKPASRAFSQLIHTPAVEKTSEVLEKTVARPSVTLGATWTALIVGGVFYFTARHFGYALSGSELLFSFIVGAGIGLIIEGLWRASRGR